jgi:putative membrane protein
MSNQDLEKKYKPIIIGLSIVIPLVVAGLFSVKIKGYDFSFLPPIYSSINTIVAILLISAVIAIKNGKRNLHRKLIRMAILGSLLFLVGYIVYHATSGDTKYGDLNHNGKLEEPERQLLGTDAFIYYFILITHIILSIATIPLILLTYLKGWTNQLEAHKKLAKYAFPLWLYVAITGPVIYLMIKQYY